MGSNPTTWTLENAPSPPYDHIKKRLVMTRGWYVEVGCSDADEMMFDGLDGCCDLMVFGPFQSHEVAEDAGFDLTRDVGPWYFNLREVSDGQ